MVKCAFSHQNRVSSRHTVAQQVFGCVHTPHAIQYTHNVHEWRRTGLHTKTMVHDQSKWENNILLLSVSSVVSDAVLERDTIQCVFRVCVCSNGCIILFMGSRKHHFEELVYLPLFNSRQHFGFTECFNVGRWSVAAQAKENWTKGEKGNDRKLANKSHLSFCHSNWGVFRKMFL